MDFVAWCGIVLDRLIEACRASTAVRVTGVIIETIPTIVFGREIADAPTYAGSSRQRGLRQALGYLYQHGSLRDAESLAAPFTIFKVTEARSAGTSGLERHWEWILNKDLDPEREALLRVVNRLSPRTATDHAWIEPITIDQIAAELEWADGTDLIRTVAEELGGNTFSGGLIRLGRTEDDCLIVEATYDGLVWETRQGAPRPLQEAIQRLFEATTGPEEKRPAVTRDFAFLADPALRSVLQQDYHETQLSLAAGVYKAAALLAAGVIEGMLLDAVQRPETEQRPNFALAVSALPRRARQADGAIIWDRIGLADLVQFAQTVGLIDQTAGRMLGATRDYRDTVHPRAEVRQAIRAGHEDAELLLALANLLYQRLEATV